MSILEHFKPPPLASDPPAKTRFWPAPPTQSSGGILQRSKLSNISASSSSSQLSIPTNPPTPSSPTASTRVSFAPLPNLTERKRRNSITLGVAARSAALRQMKERNAGPPPGGAQPAPGPRPRLPQSRGSSGSLGQPRYTYQPHQAGQPRPRRTSGRGEFKDDQVVDLGEVAIDAGKKLWRVINKKSRKSSAASESGRPDLGEQSSVGGPTVGVSGHNTEREILVRGFAVPEDIPNEEEEGERNEEEEREAAEVQAHRTEDYVADMQALRVHDDSGEAFPVDPSAVSPTHTNAADSLEPGHIHSTRHSPPPLTPESGTSDLSSPDGSTVSGTTTPNPESRPADGPYMEASSDKHALF